MVQTLEDVSKDELAVAVARSLAIANEVAIKNGAELRDCLVTITEASPPPNREWRIHYGPRDYVNRRGGDLIVVIDETTGAAQEVILGQ